MDIPLWLFALVFFWAIAVSVFCFIRNPLPFPDRGHRCFAVPSEHAARTVVQVLSEIGNLPERFTFDPGPTHQTLLWDNTTVIIHHDEEVRAQGLPPNGLSVPVKNPTASAAKAVNMLRKAGFKANMHENVMPEIGDKFVLVTSDAFNGWILACRRHILTMGKPPNMRRITR